MEPLRWNFLLSSAPILTITDRALLVPKRVPSQLSCYLSPATESKGPKHLAPVGNLHVICIHLHTPS